MNNFNVNTNMFPVDTGRKLNAHKTFRTRQGRLLNVLFTFNLRPVSTGFTGMTYLNHKDITQLTSFNMMPFKSFKLVLLNSSFFCIAPIVKQHPHQMEC